MSCVIVQYDDRIEPMFERLMQRNRDYCRRHGYEYYHPTVSYNHIPPYWIKVALIRELMAARPDVRYIAWFDSDAGVHAIDKRIESLFDGRDTEFLISEDVWLAETLNVGVFYIKVTDRTRELVDYWWSCFNPASWRKEGEKWACDGEWAGMDYEQGTLNKLVLPRFSTSIQRYPVHIFDNHRAFPSPETFSCHLIAPETNKMDNIRAYLAAQALPEIVGWVLMGVAGVFVLTRIRKGR
jgi:hypothetical protein